jgi:uncharacterized protein
VLTAESFSVRFGRRAVFGMIHLGALPGSPLFYSLDEVIDGAVADARAIRDGGCDGFVVENYGDKPFTRGRVEAETVAAMTRVIAEVTREVRIPFGVNVLRNDALSALAIAAATGAAFIRVNVHTGAMVTDQGILEGDAYATLRKRAALAPDVLIFADYLVKHATPMGEVSVHDLRDRGLADAIIVTGAATGAAADPERLRQVRAAVDAPLLLGSGLTPDNAHLFDADGAIVGTSLKVNGRVDARRVGEVVVAFKGWDAVVLTGIHTLVIMGVMNMRRVTANLPAELLDAAQDVTGKGITETLIEGLEQVQRRRFYERALRLKGKVRLDIDLEESRGRRRR